ncbi:MAG: hypothetical protein A2Z50_08160 [Nitrospirae bacterium RBG_19FT_COMBO_42_15]|nr:MAG: hypothetical protein A2Z50_08160 [Nitrospirae bacterium RBG_19FT_COMBO_42_15]
MIFKIAKFQIAVLLICLFSPIIADARIDYTIVPRLSIEGRYSDNYYNREKDYDLGKFKDDALLMTVSPGILLSLITRDTTLDLDYSLNSRGYFIEREDDRFEYFNQRGSGIFRANLSRDFSILLRDEIIKDEEITLIDETLTREERRLEYIRNIGGGGLIYRYGEGREASVDYLLTIIDYFNNIVDDNKRHDFKGHILHSFNMRNNFDISYRHSIVDYKRLNEPGQVGRDDLYEDEIRGKYMYNFTPRFSSGLNYGYVEVHYDEPLGMPPIDYHVHDAAIESIYSISRYLITDGRIGLFLREVYGMDNGNEDARDKGLIYRAGIKYTYPSFTGMTAYEGGYGSNYINPERLEYYNYWRLSGDLTYRFMRDALMLTGHGYYMVNRYPDSPNSRRDHIWNAGGGISYRIIDWLLFSLEYNHTARNSNIQGLHYVENTYLARFTISYKYSTIGKEREQKERIRDGTKRGEE